MTLRHILLPRWTLWSWFCAIAIGCLLIANWVAIEEARRSTARLKEVEHELYFFKERHGYVQRKLPATLQIKEVPMPHPCQWRYRLTLPPGQSYDVKASFHPNTEADPKKRVQTLFVGSSKVHSREVILDAYIVHENSKAYFWLGLDDDYNSMERPPVLLPPGHILHTQIPQISVNRWAAPQSLEGRRNTGGQGRMIYGWREIPTAPGQPTVLLDLGAAGIRIWMEESSLRP